jgi:hypothetical protein
MKRKPDALLLLALFFGLGLFVSALTHGDSDPASSGPIAATGPASEQLAQDRASR